MKRVSYDRPALIVAMGAWMSTVEPGTRFQSIHALQAFQQATGGVCSPWAKLGGPEFSMLAQALGARHVRAAKHANLIINPA